MYCTFAVTGVASVWFCFSLMFNLLFSTMAFEQGCLAIAVCPSAFRCIFEVHSVMPVNAQCFSLLFD